MLTRQKYAPRKYQDIITDTIVNTPRVNIFAGMGLGKTVSTLTALERLYLAGEETQPTLVIAPLRVAQSTWPDEVKKWNHLGNIEIQSVIGSKDRRVVALNNKNASVFTINYENLPWLVDYYKHNPKPWPFNTVIADESTKLKSFRLRQGSSRARALAEVAHTKVNRWVNLTGTPAPNGLKDLWGQQWFVDGGNRLGRSYSAFSQRWFRKGFNGFGLEAIGSAQGEIQKALEDCSLSLDAKDWFDLKEPIRNVIDVHLPPKAMSQYIDMEKRMFLEIEAEPAIEALNAAAKTQKCLQLANGAIYTDDKKNWAETHDVKIKALEEIIDEANGAPVLVAYHFKHDLARICKAFPNAKILDNNPNTLRDWNAGNIAILLAHPACLHSETEVLTEHRGWVKLIEVLRTDKVFDGVEFVAHKGCSYSGYKEVIDVFGVTMTLNHKLLIDNQWEEAKNVGVSEDIREKARYQYAGNDGVLSAMFELPNRDRDIGTKLSKAQPQKKSALRKLYSNYFSSANKHFYLEFLARVAVSGARFIRQGLRRTRDCRVRPMARIQKLLCGHGAEPLQRRDDRTRECEWAVLKRKLSLGFGFRPTGEQKNYAFCNVSGGTNAFGCAVPVNGDKQNAITASAKQRHVWGRSSVECGDVNLRKRKKAHVYDLVDCGPRTRFVVRNADGEVFISHNSAGHGLNLQDGGNILVFFSVNWNLEEHQQIIERIGPVRQLQAGHNRPVFIHYILAHDTLDYDVLDRLETKKSVQDSLLNAMKRRK